MNIYIVKGRAEVEGYIERVDVLENMEEKEKTYVGNGKRISKDKVGNLDGGMIIGSFEVVLLDEEDIPVARKMIKDRIVLEKTLEYQKLKTTLEKLNSHNLVEPILFRIK
ncbi:hypothetical protein [Brevibacillus sp. NRS-1366]|uniref:hypothetical protein n=1 Tax=Brevibacillus sp. NRS-1366 TaxID=3233899 RepID=UPI003D1B1F6B